MLNACGKIEGKKKGKISIKLSQVISLGQLVYDFISSDVKKGDIEVRICLHRGGYGMSAEQSVGTFVMNGNNQIKFVEYAEYGHVNEVKLE